MSYFKMLPLVTVFLIINYPIITQSCSCRPTVLQKMYCDADIVIRIKVVSKSKAMILESGRMRPATDQEIINNYNYQGDMYKRYRYRTKKVVTGEKPESTYIYTVYHDNICGGRFLEKDMYVITGSISVINGKETLTFDFCDYVEKWNDLDDVTKTIFKKRQYKNACDCEIEDCFDEGCTREYGRGDNACQLYPFGAERDCYMTTRCERNKEQKCEWQDEDFQCGGEP